MFYIIGLNEEISADSQVLTMMMEILINLNWVRNFDKAFFQNR